MGANVRAVAVIAPAPMPVQVEILAAGGQVLMHYVTAAGSFFFFLPPEFVATVTDAMTRAAATARTGLEIPQLEIPGDGPPA